MVIFEQTLWDLLTQANLVSDRVFLLRAPQVPTPKLVPPYIVFFATGPTPLHAHGGPPANEIRDYQLSIFDTSQSRALAIADSMRIFLDGYKATFENVRFDAIFFRMQTQAWETETKLCHVIQGYRIEFRLLESVVVTNPQFEPAVVKE